MSKPSKKHSQKGGKPISATELERKFETGEDISKHFDPSRDQVFSGGLEDEIPLNTKPKMVNVDFPSWVVDALDAESDRLGIARQALIKVWIAERLEHRRVAIA